MANRRNESDAKEAVREARLLFAGLFQEVRKEKEAQDPRNIAQALSLLVPLVRKKAPREQILREAKETFWLTLLDSPEAKVRKNTARVIGELYTASSSPALARKLRELLSEEQVQMIRPSYILAIGSMGFANLLDDYKVPEDTLEKHAAEEKEALRKARLGAGRSKAAQCVTESGASGFALRSGASRFSDFPADRDLILVTALGERKRKIPREKVTASKEHSVRQLLQRDRTWLEVLVPLSGPEEILPLCQACLKGEAPYRYRIELKTQTSGNHEGRGYKIRRLIEEIETLAGPSLINDPSSYEVEVRVLLGKASEDRLSAHDTNPSETYSTDVSWFLKFSCAPDERFDYRKEAIPASIHPANAAMIMRLAAPYLRDKEDPADASRRLASPRRILDPCCGSGTLLIERAKASTSGPVELVGLDIESRAIRAAKKNLAAAFQKPEDIVWSLPEQSKDQADEAGFLTEWKILQTDLKTWKLPEKDRPFDEIYANLPFGLRVGDHTKNEALYEALVRNLTKWLAPGGIAALYTMEGRLLEKELEKASGLKVLKHFRLSAGGLTPRLYIIGKKVGLN
ncbi:MAG: methyltransferase domain-containing protein [Firmicutes bacterium]|nr:methyltransferase domain-containing protein [Bacillota bacterium]